MDDTNAKFNFTPEGKLRHENDYLKSRLNNLETFKKHFFTQRIELETANERIQMLEQQLGLDTIRQHMSVSNTAENQLAQEFTQFLQQSHEKTTFDEIATLAFQAMSGWVENAGLMIFHNEKSYNYDLNNEHNEINQQMIQKHRDQGEQVNLEPHLLLNYEHISIIAQLSKATNEEQLSHWHDFLQLIAISSNSRLDYLVKNEELEELRKNIYQVFKRTNQAFEELQDDIAMHSIGVSELFINMEKTLIEVLQKTGLSTAHTDTIKQLIGSTKSELNVLLTTSMTLDESFLNVLKKLESAYSKKYGNEE